MEGELSDGVEIFGFRGGEIEGRKDIGVRDGDCRVDVMFREEGREKRFRGRGWRILNEARVEKWCQDSEFDLFYR